MRLTKEQQQQIEQAEEMFGDRLAGRDFAKGLFFGKFRNDALSPYPSGTSESTEALLEDLREFYRGLR